MSIRAAEGEGAPGKQDPKKACSVPGMSWVSDAMSAIDVRQMHRHRLDRVQHRLQQQDLGAAVLYDPINIRYATGSRNMQVWCMHNPARYAFIPAEGKTVLFEFHNCEHLSRDLETIGEIRPARSWNFYYAGANGDAAVRLWAAEIEELMRDRCGANRRLAVDACNAAGARALDRRGVRLFDGYEVLERARAIKSQEEVACMSLAIRVSELATDRMKAALVPGLSENELWAIFHETNIAHGGEYIETRLLSSGERTNPWFQECSDRTILQGDLVCHDFDMVGPMGYLVDVSRTLLCGPAKPTAEQCRLYQAAVEQLSFNMDLLKPGLSFREYVERSWRVPDEYLANRYRSIAHGVGLTHEYPFIGWPQDWSGLDYDGVIEPNMTLCVESYIGRQGGSEGVKLGQQVLVTETGAELLSTSPYEAELMM